MTTLCEKNRFAGSTEHMFRVSLIIPIFMGLLAWALASGAAPISPSQENYFERFGISVTCLAILAYPLSFAIKWNWDSRYFGAAIIPFSTTLILGVFPLVCIFRYGNLSIATCALILILELKVNFEWCWRIIKTYNKIYRSHVFFKLIYFEKPEAFYYLQQEDVLLTQKRFKRDFSPSPKYFILPLLLAIILLPFAKSVCVFIGVPFVHIFLAIVGIPLNLLFLGVCIKSWLVFYYYPKKIWKKTGKRVYIDMSSTASNYQNGES